jgi:hypothetical protein
MKKLSLFIVLIVAILCSCQHDTPPGYASPEIVTNSPPDDTVWVYHNGDTVHIDFDISDADELHEAFIWVNDSVDTLFSYDPYVHELPSFHVDTFWIVHGITGLTPGFVSAEAENHHDKITIINVPIMMLP